MSLFAPTLHINILGRDGVKRNEKDYDDLPDLPIQVDNAETEHRHQDVVPRSPRESENDDSGYEDPPGATMTPRGPAWPMPHFKYSPSAHILQAQPSKQDTDSMITQFRAQARTQEPGSATNNISQTGPSGSRGECTLQARHLCTHGPRRPSRDPGKAHPDRVQPMAPVSKDKMPLGHNEPDSSIDSSL